MDGIEMIFEDDVPERIAAHRDHIYDRIYQAAARLKKMPSGAVKVEIGNLRPQKAQAKAHVAFRSSYRWKLRTTTENGFLFMRKIPKNVKGQL